MPPRQGIFGGTFDPPHVGHVAAAVCARDQLGTDIVHVVVANDPWQKSAERSVTPANHRLAMAQLAFGGLSGIEVSELEIERGGPTYTIDTVIALERPGTETMLIVGPAAASGLPTWHRVSELSERVRLAVVQPRNEPRAHLAGWRTETVFMDPVEASATLVRDLLIHRTPSEATPEVARHVPPAVMSYITRHSLYCP